MIFCPKCGTQNPDGAAFCAGCGANLSERPQAAPQQAASHGAVPGGPAYATASGGHAAQPAAGKSKLPVIVGAVVVIAAIVLALMFFVLPNCSGVGGANLDVKTLTSGKASEAQAVLDKLTKGEIDMGGDDLVYYASSDKMVDYVDSLYDDASDGDISDWDDVMDSDTAKELNGEWVLFSMADDSLEDAVDSINESQDLYDMGHMVIYATVVADKDLDNAKVASLVSGAGVPYEHCVVGDSSISDTLDLYSDLMKASGSLAGGYNYYASSIEEIGDVIEDAGAKSYGFGTYYGKDSIALSASVQFEDYAVVLVWADNPANISGLDKIYNEDYLKRLYVK